MNFKLKPVHVSRLKATVKQFGHAIIHGDGNIYVDETKENADGTIRRISKSNEHATFHTSAPGDHRHEYFARYKKGAQLPNTVEELEKDLVSSKMKEELKQTLPDHEKRLKIISSTEEKEEKANKAPDKKADDEKGKVK
jgi:hypothetical protein